MATAVLDRTETKARIISTGNSEIDKKLGGGIPLGSLILIEGQSDSGKSVLIQQIAWGSLRDGFSFTLMTTEDTVKSLLRQMKSLNLDILDYLLLGRFRVFHIRNTEAATGATLSPKQLLGALRAQSSDMVAIDSITSFIAHSPEEDVISFFEECKGLCAEGMSLAVVAHPYAFSQGMLVRISSLCDTHLRFTIESAGEKLMKTMEVAKIRGAQQSTGGVFSFDVEPGWGMRPIPFSKARA